MNRFWSIFLSIFFAVFIVSIAPICAKQECKPLKVIAPDLIVESFEFGEFPDGPKEFPIEKVKFIPTSVTEGGFIGYRLKLKTSRKKITWRHRLDKIEGKDHLKDVANGTIYTKWVITAGFPKGKHTIRGWIEGVELPPIRYIVK